MSNIIGGPEDNTGKTETVVEQVAQAEQPKPIYLGNKAFNSQDELVAYTQELQNKLIEKEMVKPLPAMETANQPKPSQLLFEDPDAFYELTVQEAERRVETKLKQENAKKEVWNKFWTENKDLKEFEDLVQAKFIQIRQEDENLPVDKGLSKIASEVRGILAKARGSVQGGKELPTGPAMVAGTSNGIATTQVAVKSAPSTFVDQIRQKQKKGKR